MRGFLELLGLAALLALLLATRPDEPPSHRSASRTVVADATDGVDPRPHWEELLGTPRLPFAPPGEGGMRWRALRRALAWTAFPHPFEPLQAVLGRELALWPSHPLIDAWRRGGDVSRLGERDATGARARQPHVEDFGDWAVHVRAAERVPVQWRGIPGRSPGDPLASWLANPPFTTVTDTAPNALWRHEVIVERRGRQRSEVQVVFVFERRVVGARFGLDEQARGERWHRFVQVGPDELQEVWAIPVDEGAAEIGLVERERFERLRARFAEDPRDANPRDNVRSGVPRSGTASLADPAGVRGVVAGFTLIHQWLSIALGGA